MSENKECEKKSIYKMFVENISKDNKLPYEFQNVYKDGKKDVLFELWGENPMYEERIVYSKALLVLIEEILEGNEKLKEVDYFLEQCPIYYYYDFFLKKLKIKFLEGVINKERLYTLGIHLATESSEINKVKLGILILSLYENDITRQIIKTLGYHSEFTLYALEASKDFVKCNTLVYEFFKGTDGYGKLIAMQRLNILNKDIEKDIIEIGYKNTAIPHIESIFVLEKGNLNKYIGEDFNEKRFGIVSSVLAYGLDDVEVQKFTKLSKAIEQYIDYSKIYSKTFLDLIAVLNIHKSMIPTWKNYSNDNNYKNGWSKELESNIKLKCNNIIANEKWKHIILSELSKMRYSSKMLVMALQAKGLRPAFEEFYYILSMDNFDFDLFEYMLFECGSYYIEELVNYIKYVAPWEEILLTSLSEDVKTIDKKYTPDVIIEFLLVRMRECNITDMDFFIKCLKARLPKCRYEAVKCLDKNKENIDEDIRKILEEMYLNEESKNVKKALGRLLNKNSYSDFRKERYVKINDINILPTAKDLKIVQCNVAGAYYNNLDRTDMLRENGMLYLKMEPENIYDVNAILVTDRDGYVIGYIPRKFTLIICNLIKGGERIYAIIESLNLEESKIEISVMLSKDEKGKASKGKFRIVKI